MSNEFTSESVKETIAFGRQFGEGLVAGDVVALHGPLGSGKTHLVKGIAQALGIDEKTVHSPTYTLIHEYSGRIPLYHFDCYRVKTPQEALEIGAEEYFYGEGICTIEWPEKIGSVLPEFVIWIDLKTTGPDERIIKLVN